MERKRRLMEGEGEPAAQREEGRGARTKDEKVDYKCVGEMRRSRGREDDGWAIALLRAISVSYFRFWRNWEKLKK